MSTTTSGEDFLREKIHTSLQRALAQKTRLQQLHTRYGLANTILSAFVTFLAGLPSVSGQLFLPGDWRVTCGAVAVVGLIATVVSGLQQQLAGTELLNEVSECVVKLRSIELETLSPAYNLDVVRRQYQEVLTAFPRVES